MSFAPYLGFPGTCREAMTFYAEVFGATDLQIMSNADAPEGALPPGDDPHRVLHAQFNLGPGAPLMGSDVPPWMPSGRGSPTVYHAAPDRTRAEAVFALLSAGVTIHMPMAATFWSEAFGFLTDRFGTAWMITVAPTA